MKHIIFVLLLVTYTFSKAQDAFNKSESMITLGYGLPNIYKRLVKQDMQNTDAQTKSMAKYYGSSFTYSTSGIGPLFFKYEHALTDKFGLGFVIGYFKADVTETYNYKRSLYVYPIQSQTTSNYYQAITRSARSLSVGARFNYHFGEKRKIDPYIGFAIGYSHNVMEETFATNDPSVPDQPAEPYIQPFPLYFGATLGIRDYITDKFGVYIELGFDKWSLIQGGLAFKFPK